MQHQGLVDLARRGDEEAFTDLARAVGDRLMAIAYRILRDADRAEDAVQQALVIAWRELPTLRDPDRFDAWLRRILVNACYAEARRHRRWAANIRVLPVDGPDGRDDMSTVVERDRLERGFRRLSPEQRAIFVLHHDLGLTLAEIAGDARCAAWDGQVAPSPRRPGPSCGARRRCAIGHHRGATRMTTDRDFDRIARMLADRRARRAARTRGGRRGGRDPSHPTAACPASAAEVPTDVHPGTYRRDPRACRPRRRGRVGRRRRRRARSCPVQHAVPGSGSRRNLRPDPASRTSTRTFISPRNGLRVNYPGARTVTPATSGWLPGTQ